MAAVLPAGGGNYGTTVRLVFTSESAWAWSAIEEAVKQVEDARRETDEDLSFHSAAFDILKQEFPAFVKEHKQGDAIFVTGVRDGSLIFDLDVYSMLEFFILNLLMTPQREAFMKSKTGQRMKELWSREMSQDREFFLANLRGIFTAAAISVAANGAIDITINPGNSGPLVHTRSGP